MPSPFPVYSRGFSPLQSLHSDKQAAVGWGFLKANNHFIKNLNEKNSMNEYFWGRGRIFTLVIRIRSKIGENLAPCIPAEEAAGKDQTRSCFPQ